MPKSNRATITKSTTTFFFVPPLRIFFSASETKVGLSQRPVEDGIGQSSQEIHVEKCSVSDAPVKWWLNHQISLCSWIDI